MKPLLIVLLVFLPAISAFAGEGDTHFFILSGQSNMAGLKPENAFLPELKKLLPGEKIAHIKVAVGGQPIRMWVAEWDDIAKKNGLDELETAPVYYPQIVSAYKKAVEAHGKPASVTFLWMQGEKDAKSGLSAAYEPSLKQLIESLRDDLDAPEMNIVIGRLSDHSPGGASQEGWDTVREMQLRVAKGDGRGAWVDTDDCNNKTKKDQPYNDLHYTKDGYDLFGQRLARQAVLLINGKKPAANGRPE